MAVRLWRSVRGAAGVVLALAWACTSKDTDVGSATRVRKVTFQGDRARTGWNPRETALRPDAVRSSFGPTWSSPPLDPALIGGVSVPAHVYATPLFVEAAPVNTDDCRGDVAYVATTSAYVYAIAAADIPCASHVRGEILWRTRLGTPGKGQFDGGMPVGVLSTPFIDVDSSPPRIYVGSMDATAGWQLFALDLASGRVLPKWPVTFDDASLGPVNKNGPSRFNHDPTQVSQRAALNLSPDLSRVYISFAGYYDSSIGWLAAVDTASATIAAAFAASPSTRDDIASGGMWGPGGVTIDERGDVYGSTGNSPVGSLDGQGVWGQSVLHWSPALDLVGTYTPFNYCLMDRYDTDLAGSSPTLLPSLDTTGTTTPRLLAFGGKQGNVYLLDRDHFPGRTDHRPACDEAHVDSSTDGSLLPPGPQPQFGRRGPLNVFGPYSEDYANLDYARMRSSVAQFRDGSGNQFLFASGTPKRIDPATGGLLRNVRPPCLVRLRVNADAGAPAYLGIDATNDTVVFKNPGSPTISSNGTDDAVVWVIDENAWRTDSLVGDGVAGPILYAFDASTLELLYRSAPGDLHVGGKYATATIAKGTVYVATDRLQAFGVSDAARRPTGTFSKTVLDTAYRAEGVGVLDVDKDGHLDLATDQYWYAGPTFTTRHEIRGASDDPTKPPETYDPRAGIYAHCFAAYPWDLDGDGFLDLVIAPHVGEEFLWYQNPRGKEGHWTPHTIAPAGVEGLETPIVVDLFGDGKLEVLSSDTVKGVLGWWVPTADPTQPWTLHAITAGNFPGAGGAIHGIGAGDLNGDGKLDVLTGYAWFEQTADRDTWKMHPFDAGNECARMWTYDVDGDGLADVFCSRPHSYGVYWYQQQADGTFVPHAIDETVSEFHNLRLQDLDGDGIPELVGGKRWLAHADGTDPGANDPSVLVYWKLRGKGVFEKHVVDDDSGAGGSFFIGDVDGDGLTDIVTANKKGLFFFRQK